MNSRRFSSFPQRLGLAFLLGIVGAPQALGGADRRASDYALPPLPPQPAGAVGEPWCYAGETSAIVYWQTEFPARSRVEYGLAEACPQQTPLSDISPISGRPYWTHFHRLLGLQPQTAYYYRMVSIGTDGTVSRGPLQTLHTKRYDVAIRIPEQLAGPPYVLDRPGATYLLTRDLTFPLGGLLIKADGITLDLDGHRLLYNDQPAQRPSQWDKRAYEGHDFGIRIEGRVQATILNGSIWQGRGNTAGTVVGVGCNPLYSQAAAIEIAGVDIAWSGAGVSGFYLHGCQHDHLHHCVIDDRGTVVGDRHMGVHAVGANAWGDYDHNLVKAARQQALANGVQVLHNEIYLRSCATNSFGITAPADADLPVDIAFNHILGIGEHPVGIGLFGAYRRGARVHDNWVEVKCTSRGEEYGYTGCACFRTTWGADQLDVGHNTFIAYADLYDGQPAKARALWVGLPFFTPKGSPQPITDARGVFHHNRIVALGPDGAPAGGICVVCLNQSPHLIFHHNRVSSSWGNVLLADSYGHADGYAKFVGNIFQREGRGNDYFAVRQEYGGIPATGVFFENQFPPATDRPPLKLQEKGRLVFLDAIEIRVNDPQGRPLGGAAVSVRDQASREVFAGVTAAAETAAMLVSQTSPTLRVEQPPQPQARGYIESVVLPPGTLTAILSARTCTQAGEKAAGAYTARITKEGFQEAAAVLPLGKLPQLDITLVPRPQQP